MTYEMFLAGNSVGHVGMGLVQNFTSEPVGSTEMHFILLNRHESSQVGWESNEQ